MYATFEFLLLDSEGSALTHADYTITLKLGEVSTLANFVTSKLAAFELETGLTSA